MRWSQLKKQIEATFVPSVRGRVQVWNTRYRKSGDAEGEAWITLDGVRFWSMGSLSYLAAKGSEATRIREEQGCEDFRQPEQYLGYMAAECQAHAGAHDAGIFAKWDVNRALFDYLNLSIDSAMSSDDPIIRGFAMLDERLGKRRLEKLRDKIEHPFVRALYDLRCRAESTK